MTSAGGSLMRMPSASTTSNIMPGRGRQAVRASGAGRPGQDDENETWGASQAAFWSQSTTGGQSTTQGQFGSSTVSGHGGGKAGAMARGGDVFVLDMGEPVKIYDLAQKLIELSGLTLRNEQNPDGDIEIEVIGLRPGEKLYEELLIGDNPQLTTHPRVMRAQDDFLPWTRLEDDLKKLEMLLNVTVSMIVYKLNNI